MVKFFHFFTGFLLLFSFALTVSSVEFSAQPAAADENCKSNFLGFPAWYEGLTEGADCHIKSPDAAGGLSAFIWHIALNVVAILLRLVGYVSVVFIIIGGFNYMTSAGSPDGIARAKKTIMNAVIGLVLSIASVAIVQLVAGAIK